jgi:predicted dehydrogenase
MIKAAEAAGKKLFAHQNYYCHPDVRHLQDVVMRGMLGRVSEVRIHALSFSRRNNWRTLRKYSGGNLNNTCLHDIST